MKAITLRDIPESIAEIIQRQAEANGTSLNRTVIDMLATANNPTPRRQKFHDLDHLIGTWTTEEANEIERAIEMQRVIDTEMWK